MDPVKDSDGSIVITDDFETLPSAAVILRSFRKRATITTAKAATIASALVGVVRAVDYAQTASLGALASTIVWAVVAALFAVGSAIASRGHLDRGAYVVLGGVVLAVGTQSFFDGAVLAITSFCIGYPVLYLLVMGIAPPEHFRSWTRAMPILFALNVLGRQLLSPLDLLRDPLNLATVAGGGAIGMLVVGRVAEGLLRALRHSLAYSETIRSGLEKTQKQLVAHRQALEARVSERTRDLEAKNISLAETLESLQRTQVQLVQSEKMASLGLLVAGIAHEIKNPLNFVNNFAELALEFIDDHRTRQAASGGTDPPDVEATLNDVADNLTRIREHGLRADGIINAMLMHARDRRGEPIAVDFNAMLVEHANLAYHGFRAADRTLTVEIVKSIDPEVGRVMVPYQELARVIVNLVSNACHAMRQRLRSGEPEYRPQLRLATHRQGDIIELTIADNGTGISQEVRRRIFDPFFTTKPPGEGTGLGLSLSYEIIVKELGGSIDVESTVGDGATFVVRVSAPATHTE